MIRKTTQLRLSLPVIGVAAGIGLLGVNPANADVIFQDSSTVGGNAVTATADFKISGTTLTITLTNTSPAAALEAPTNTLTGIQFSIGSGDPALTPVSAISPNPIVNSADCNASPCTGSNVNIGGELGYQQNFSGLEAIGSAGYISTGLAGNLGNFNGVNLQDPVSLDGIEFGIISATHGPFNGGLSTQALVQDTAVFTLTIPTGTTEGSIGSVSFLYGTAPDASVPGTRTPVPEPASLALFGTALAGLGLFGRRRRRKDV